MSDKIKDRKQITIYLEHGTANKLEKYAKKIKVSRQRLIENLLENGLEDLNALEKTGMLFVGVGLRDLFDQVRNKSEINAQLEI